MDFTIANKKLPRMSKKEGEMWILGKRSSSSMFKHSQNKEEKPLFFLFQNKLFNHEMSSPQPRNSVWGMGNILCSSFCW